MDAATLDKMKARLAYIKKAKERGESWTAGDVEWLEYAISVGQLALAEGEKAMRMFLNVAEHL